MSVKESVVELFAEDFVDVSEDLFYEAALERRLADWFPQPQPEPEPEFEIEWEPYNGPGTDIPRYVRR